MNPLYSQYGASQQQLPPQMAESFKKYLEFMKGKDPRALINGLLTSGKLSQQQLNAIQQQAQQMQGLFMPFFKQ